MEIKTNVKIKRLNFLRVCEGEREREGRSITLFETMIGAT